MLKNDFLSINKFLDKNLNSTDKLYRKNIANTIESKISYILDKNEIFNEYNLSRSYTDVFNIYIKNIDRDIFVNIKYKKDSNFLNIFVITPLFYFIDNKYPIKLHSELLTEMKSQIEFNEINETGEYEAFLFTESIDLTFRLEEDLEKSLININRNLESFNKDFLLHLNQIDENKIYYFNNEGKLSISPDELFNLSYQISSIGTDIHEINNDLFKIYTDSDSKDKKRIELIIAHLNIPLARPFFSIDMEFLTIEELIYSYQKVLASFLHSIRKYDLGEAKFSTYSRFWLLQAFSRANEIIIRERMKEKYGVFPSHHQLSTFNTEFNKSNGSYPTFEQKLLNAESISKVKLNAKKEKDRKRNNENISKSSFFKLFKLISNTNLYSEKKLFEKVLHIFELSEVCLIGKQKTIFQKRYFPGGNKTLLPPTSLQVLGDEHGLTRERIRQIEKNALNKIKFAYGKYPDSKKINKTWLKPIIQKENKRGISKALLNLEKMNIFFMGQIKNLSNDEFYELFKDTTVTKKAVDKLYFEINPIQSLKKTHKDFKIEILNLSNRSFNALKSQNIEFVSQIDLNELEDTPNLGDKSINEIREKIMNFNKFI
tara:strand:+ start:1845 stop:3644 length:1800 start_codon:yes stop_codon:yes gene_type:complete